MDPIKIYKDGQFDYKRYIADKAKKRLSEQLDQFVQTVDTIFVDHSLRR